MSMPRTRFAGLSRAAALLILATTAVCLVACLAVALTAEAGEAAPTEKVDPEKSDWAFYQRVVESVRAGQSYYDVVPAELKRLNFNAFSIFNYRPPLYAWFLAVLPEPCAHLLLIALSLAALATTFVALQRQAGTMAAWGGSFLLLSGLLWCVVPVAIYAHEVWMGALLTLSLAAYGLGRRLPALAAALAALFLRELTLPYCLIAAFFAVRQRQRAETIGWALGFAVYAIYMAVHIRAVRQIMPPQATRSMLEWVQFGGIPFLLSTTRMNFFLLNFMPQWLTAIYLPLALLGLSGWKGEMGTRTFLTVAAYTLAFSVVGQAVNGYWGFLDAPLLALGLLWLPAVLRDLWQAVTGSTPATAESTPADPQLQPVIQDVREG
jgi:hypothetical protein